MTAKKRFFIIIIFLLLAYLVIGLATGSFQNQQVMNRYAKAQKVYEREFELNKELKARLEQAQSPDFIELTAREKLGFVKPGETAYKVLEEE